MGGGYAWVTLATNDSYSLGALVLAHALKQVGTQQQLAVLITPGVTSPMRTKLSEIFNVVKEVNILDSKDEANLKLLKRPELGITFTKLHCWRLTQFEKCVFLDADTLVLENCDELFEREELSAAPDIGWPDCFNSGVFVYRPSNDTYDKLIQFALEKGSFDGGDQGLLNLYFSDWAHKDISKHLPFIYNMSSTACYSYLPAFKQFGKNAKIIHFLGSSKPWLQYFNTETRKVHPSEGLNHLEQIIQLWWNIFCDLIHPKLSSDMTSHTDTMHGSQSYTSQNLTHTSYYHQDNPSSSNPIAAEGYQNVWDPWEEYDSRQSDNDRENTSHDIRYSEPLHSQQFVHQSHVESFNIQHSDTYIHHTEHRPPDHHPHIDHRPPDHQPHIDHSHIYIKNKHEPNIHNLKIHSHHQEIVENHSSTHESHSQQNITEFHSQQNLIESHNTNAFSKADSHDHIHHPAYSQPQHPQTYCEPPHIPSTHYEHPHNSSSHYEPPRNFDQENSSNKPPPSDPRLPDECVATTTVSNEITLQTDFKEDSNGNDNQAGLAGAFANLTLGQARTPEQQALDDHLRRQGWEVGNIDYLGKDAFDNIWSKICETLSGATEKEASSPKTEEKPAELEDPPLAAATEKVEPVQDVESVGSPAPSEPVATPAPSEIAVTPTLVEPVASPVPAEQVATTAMPEPVATPAPVEPVATTPAPVEPVAISALAELVATPAVALSSAETPKPTEPVGVETPIALEKPAVQIQPTPEAATVQKTPLPILQDTPTEGTKLESASKLEPSVPVESLQSAQPAATELPKVVPVPLSQVPAQVPVEVSKEISQTPKEVVASKEVAQAPIIPIESLSEVPPVEASKQSSAETPEQEALKNAPAEDPKQAPVESTKQAPVESPKQVPVESPKQAPVESPKQAPVESPKQAPVESPKQAPVESPKQAPVESPKQAPVESPKQAPVESPKQAPVESSTQAPVESPKQVPVETPKQPEAQKQLPTAAPKESSVQHPAEAPASKQTSIEASKVPKQDSKEKKLEEIAPAKTTDPLPIVPTTPKAVETTTASPQAKGLGIETSVPDSSPPATPEAATAASPTPPPRKGSGTPKKSGGKKK